MIKCQAEGKCGGLAGGGPITSFLSAYGIKLLVSEGHVGRNMVVIEVGETYVASLGQEYVMCNEKVSVKGWGGGSGAATIMEF